MTYTLPGTDEKSRYVEQKFDEIAQKYDRFNDLITFGMHRYWKRFVVRQTGLHPKNTAWICAVEPAISLEKYYVNILHPK